MNRVSGSERGSKASVDLVGEKLHQVHKAASDRNKDSADEDSEEGEYDVTKFYKENSCIADIARSKIFEHLTLGVITINAVWMGVDMDHNHEKDLLKADVIFIVAENTFCAYFSMEVVVRFLSFEKKINALKDNWFRFDAALVSCMILETWIIPIMSVLSGGGEGPPLGNLSILRLLRLLRLTRITRLMRAMPELLTLIKGMVNATRSVFSTLVLLIIATYVMAIIFTQQLRGELDPMFSCMGMSMLTLFVNGTLLDDLTSVLKDILEVNQVMMWLFVVYIILSSMTILNMLIGVLCEVVSQSASEEKDAATLLEVKNALAGAFRQIDTDGSGLISKGEFEKLTENTNAMAALSALGVNKDHLESMRNSLFTPIASRVSLLSHGSVSPHGSPNGAAEANKSFEAAMHVVAGADGQESLGLTFDQFVEQVINHRPSTKANVLDCAQLRSVMNQELKSLEIMIDNLSRDIQMSRGNDCSPRTDNTRNPHSFQAMSGGPRVELCHETTEDLFDELFRRNGHPNRNSIDNNANNTRRSLSRHPTAPAGAGRFGEKEQPNLGSQDPKHPRSPGVANSSQPLVLGSLAGPLAQRSSKSNQHPPALELK